MEFWIWVVGAFLLGAVWGWHARKYDDERRL